LGNFYTDTIQKDGRFSTTARVNDLNLLEPHVRAKVLAILHDAAAHGVSLMVYETFRSEARQLQLFNAGASKLRTVGCHGYGLAADIVFNVGGEPSWKGDFSLLAHLARAHQLISGSDWGHPSRPTSFVDADHVQWLPVWRQGALFRGEWFPSGDYDPYADNP
jgi:hypothetical protein